MIRTTRRYFTGRRHRGPRGWALVGRTLADIGHGLLLAASALLGTFLLFMLFYGVAGGPDWLRWAVGVPFALALLAVIGSGRRNRWDY